MIRWMLAGLAVLAVLALAVTIAGWLLPVHHVASREAPFQRPPEDVWAVIHDVARQAEWRSQVRSIRILQAEPLRWVEDGPHGAITYEVDDAQPPRRLVVRIADPDLPFGGRWIYELLPSPAGTTTLRITEEGEVRNPLFRFMSRYVFSQTATLEAFLRDLERHLASG